MIPPERIVYFYFSFNSMIMKIFYFDIRVIVFVYCINNKYTVCIRIQGVPRGKIDILGDKDIDYFKQKCSYECISYFEYGF